MEKAKEFREHNKLIAKFMDLEIITDGISFFDTSYKPLKHYHSSWNDLMPVVIKIRTNYYGIGANRYQLMLQLALCTPNIEDIHKVVVEFIKWYNQNLIDNTNK